MIKLAHVSKSFRKNKVLKDISFNINEKECVALIGPNGSGKTTLIKCILGLIKIDSGNIIRDFSTKRDIGIMTQNDIFPDGLSVKNVINLHRGYFGKETLDANTLIQSCGLENFKNKQISSISGGERKRVSYAIAIANKPKILFLDEPTVGMDIDTRDKFWNDIKKQQKQGTTVFVTLHHLDELNDYCGRYIFIKDGYVKYDVTRNQLCNNKIIVIEGKSNQLAQIHNEFGGTIHNEKIYISSVNNKDKLIQYIKLNHLSFEERFTRVQDIYIELYH